MRIGIKIGSSLLADYNDGLSSERILNICQQIAALIRNRHQVFLVTSGAVISDPQKSRPKNLRAAIGMGRLIGRYIEYFDVFGIEAAQMLFTDNDLHQRCRGSLIGLLEKAMENMVVPIINANDTVDWTELKQLEICADNDILFMNLCLALKPQMAIIGFDQDGVLDDESCRMPVINEGNFLQLAETAQGGSFTGHGSNGMLTKMQIARVIAASDIKTLIVSGLANAFIIEGVNELSRLTGNFGTRFVFNQLEFNFDQEPFKVKNLEELRLEHGVFS
ncbi:MAG: hypothetical protein WC473_02180 [Patescibacteria group bacterium]|jgi:glutamate 5-kinase